MHCRHRDCSIRCGESASALPIELGPRRRARRHLQRGSRHIQRPAPDRWEHSMVFPLEPVIAIIFLGRNKDANSISPITGSPRARAWTRGAESTGTPGLTTMKSCPRKVRSPCPPVSTAIPWSSRTGISLPSWSCGFASETVTRAPLACRKSADATPDLPRPTTSTRLLARSIKALPATSYWRKATGVGF